MPYTKLVTGEWVPTPQAELLRSVRITDEMVERVMLKLAAYNGFSDQNIDKPWSDGRVPRDEFTERARAVLAAAFNQEGRHDD